MTPHAPATTLSNTEVTRAPAIATRQGLSIWHRGPARTASRQVKIKPYAKIVNPRSSDQTLDVSMHLAFLRALIQPQDA